MVNISTFFNWFRDLKHTKKPSQNHPEIIKNRVEKRDLIFYPIFKDKSYVFVLNRKVPDL